MDRWTSLVGVLVAGLGVGCAPARGPAAWSGAPAATTTTVEVADVHRPAGASVADGAAPRREPLAGRWVRTADGWVWRSDPLEDGRWVELEMPAGAEAPATHDEAPPEAGEAASAAETAGAGGDDPRLPAPAERPGALRLASPRPSGR